MTKSTSSTGGFAVSIGGHDGVSTTEPSLGRGRYAPRDQYYLTRRSASGAGIIQRLAAGKCIGSLVEYIGSEAPAAIMTDWTN